MNIGIVTTWFECGAGHVSRSYESVLEKMHNVFIYARGGMATDNDKSWNRPNVTRAHSHPCSTGIHEKHFERWVAKHGIDAVIFNEQRHWAGVLSARRAGVLVGAYVDYYTADTVPFFDLYDFLICNTRRHYGVFQHHPQACYCPWGTRTDVYVPAKRPVTRPVTFIISSGWDGAYTRANAWMDRRGAGMAMRVFSKTPGDCRLIVLSQVSLAECPDEWQKIVKEEPRIEFRVGTFNPIPYSEGDIYVYPSRLDGIGLTLPEAISCGLPAITTNSPPMNEFVSHEKNGLLVDVKEFRGRPDGYYWPEAICNEEQLAQALSYYVNDPDKIAYHGKNARIMAESELTWEKNAAFILDWIPRQIRLSDRSGVNLASLSARALTYDRGHNPSPLQRTLTGGKAFVNYALRRI